MYVVYCYQLNNYSLNILSQSKDTASRKPGLQNRSAANGSAKKAITLPAVPVFEQNETMVGEKESLQLKSLAGNMAGRSSQDATMMEAETPKINSQINGLIQSIAPNKSQAFQFAGSILQLMPMPDGDKINNQKLYNICTAIWKPHEGEIVGDGSAMAALNWEVNNPTKPGIGGRSHLQKLQDLKKGVIKCQSGRLTKYESETAAALIIAIDTAVAGKYVDN